MKMIFSSVVFLAITTLGFFSYGQAHVRHMQVRGDKARNLMEALAGAGFKMQMGGDFSQKPITIEAKDLTCKYTTASFPDEWMSDAKCYLGDGVANTPVLSNSLAVAKAIGAVAFPEGALGSRYYGLSSIACVLSYETKAYSCDVSQAQVE